MIVRLTDVCDFQGGSQPPKKEWKNSPREGYVRMLQIRDFTQGNEDHIAYVKDSNNLKKCNSDDVLLGRYGASVGKILTGLEGAYNVAIIKAIPNEDILSKHFLFYHFKSPQFQNFINSVAVRAAQAGFNKEDLSQYKFELPSLSDQIKIATLLKKVEDLIQKRKESIDLLDELIKSTFLEMFGDPVVNPKGWDLAVLENLTSKIGSGSTPRGGKESYIEEGISLIRSLNVYDNAFKMKDLAFISDEQAQKLRNVEVFEGDVLFNITGASVCRCTIVPTEILPARVNQHVAILRPKSEILSSYLSYLLVAGNMKNKLLKVATQGGATREAITKEQLENLEIPVATKELQLKFDEFIEKSNELRKSNSESLQQLRNLYNSISQRVFKGELDLSKINVDRLLPKTEPRDMAMYDPNKDSSSLTDKDLEALIKEREENPMTDEVIRRSKTREALDIDDEVLTEFGATKNTKKHVAKLITEAVTYAQVSKWILENYKEYHFTAEMLLRFLKEEKGMLPYYYTSKEIKENGRKDMWLDVKSMLFDALQITDREDIANERRLKLEQVFYDDEQKNFAINIRPQDKELFNGKTAEQRSGIYLKVKA